MTKYSGSKYLHLNSNRSLRLLQFTSIWKREHFYQKCATHGKMAVQLDLNGSPITAKSAHGVARTSARSLRHPASDWGWVTKTLLGLFLFGFVSIPSPRGRGLVLFFCSLHLEITKKESPPRRGKSFGTIFHEFREFHRVLTNYLVWRLSRVSPKIMIIERKTRKERKSILTFIQIVLNHNKNNKNENT